MKILRMKGILAGVIFTSLGLSITASAAPLDFQLNVGTQPVYAAPAYQPPLLAAPPLMIWLSNLGVYAAYGASQPVFYQGSNYYYYYGNRWWSGPGYRGPWRPLAGPPPALRSWNHRDWQRVQRDARGHARDPHWRHFRPAARPLPAQRPQRGPQYQHPQPPRGPQGGRPQLNRPGPRPEQGRPDHGHGHGPDRGQNGRGQQGQNWQQNNR